MDYEAFDAPQLFMLLVPQLVAWGWASTNLFAIAHGWAMRLLS